MLTPGLWDGYSEYSKQLNASRLKVLQSRENSVASIIKEAGDALTKVSKDKKYKDLLGDLLIQVGPM